MDHLRAQLPDNVLADPLVLFNVPPAIAKPALLPGPPMLALLRIAAALLMFSVPPPLKTEPVA